MKNNLILSITCAFCLAAAYQGTARAEGIPEPGIVLYGVVTDPFNGSRLTSGTLEVAYRDGSGKSVTNVVPVQNLGNAYSYVTEIRFESPVAGHPVTGADVFELPTNTAPAKTFTRSSAFGGAMAILQQGTSDSATWAQKGKLQRLDLTISAPDTDGDGVPDYWEMQYFGNLSRNGTLDRDGDGVSDRAEYLSGTHPNDPNSFFKLTGIQKLANSVTIRWRGPADRTFSVLYSTNGATGYLPVATNIPPAATDISLTLPIPGDNRGFYRIKGN